MQEIVIEDKTVEQPKQKRKYVRRATATQGSARPEVPTPVPVEEIPVVELTPMHPDLNNLRNEIKKTGLMALSEKEQRRHGEMEYIIGIIDTLALKHAHKHQLDMQTVKDDIIVRIIRGVHA